MNQPFDINRDEELGAALRQALRQVHDAPPAWQARALDLWPRPGLASAVAAAVTAVREFVAALSFDSAAATPLAMGLRSVGGAARHLVFTAGEVDVELRIEAQGAAWRLSGQVLGSLAEPTVAVELQLQGGAAEDVRRTALNAWGEFTIDAVPAGCMVLRIQGPAGVLRTDAFELGTPSA